MANNSNGVEVEDCRAGAEVAMAVVAMAVGARDASTEHPGVAHA